MPLWHPSAIDAMTSLETRQRAICERFDAAYTPVAPEQLCAISVGVYEGDPVQGVRYPAPPHMSGWYITTAKYSGDHRSLKVEHVAHVAERRPDFAVYLALPPGYRFEVGGGVAAAWFDATVGS